MPLFALDHYYSVLPVFVKGWALSQLWLFIVAPIIGAVIAALVYQAISTSAPTITATEAEQSLASQQAER